MKSSATRFRALGRPGAVIAFCLVCGTCVLTPALKGQYRRADGTSVAPGKALSQIHSDRTSSAKIVGYLGALPLAFEPNQGQSSEGVKYVAHGPRYNVFFTSRETVFELGGSSRVKRPERRTATPIDILRMSLKGADTSTDLVAAGQLPGKTNYLIGPRENWHSGIPNYRRILQRRNDSGGTCRCGG